MTSQETGATTTASDEEEVLLAFLGERLGQEVGPTQDLFESGLVTSMFAMELVVHIEQSFEVAVAGPDLKLDNFRTARTMAELVRRLRTEESDAD